jgi:Raf kinase inhibitor-like YbhB/YbcL family protein
MSLKRIAFAFAIAIVSSAGLGCSDDTSSPDAPTVTPDARAATPDAGPAFTLEGTDLVDGKLTAAQTANVFGCTGQNASPALRWSNPPAGTKSFVLTMFDTDAPTGSGFWHWTLFDIPAATTSLAANAAAGTLPVGSTQGYVDFGRPGYGGPCPPAGDPPHHYVFKLYALGVEALGLDEHAPGAEVTFATVSAVPLGTATFTATYEITGSPTSHPAVPTLAGFTLTSDEITEGGTIANNQVLNSFGCSGDNVSPSLHWTGAPAGTQSFVLTLFDPDAPTGSGFWHWLAFNIPAATTSIAKGAGTAGAALGGGVQGYNDTGANAYAGPCPPAGDAPHHYTFTIYAIPTADLTPDGLSAAATGGLVGFVTLANATAKAELKATYGR